MVHLVAEHVLEHAGPGAIGVRGLGHLGQLQRVAQQHHVGGRSRSDDRVGQRQLPGFVDQQDVDARVVARHVVAGKQPGGSGDQVEVRVRAVLVRPRVFDVGDRLLDVVRDLLHCSQAVELAFLLEQRHGLSKQVVDGVVAHRGDAHSLAVTDQGEDEVGSAVGLAGSGRPLDGHEAVVELGDPLAHVGEVIGEVVVDRTAAGAERREVAAEQGERHRVRVTVGHRVDHLVGQLGQGVRLGPGGDPVIERHRGRDHAHLLRPVCPLQLDHAVFGFEAMDRSEAGHPVGTRVHDLPRLVGPEP